MKRTGLSLITALAFASGLLAQDPKIQLPQASPSSIVKQTVGVTDIELVYARPSVKEREIFGKLVPFGAVWRTGANSTTKISFSTPIKLNGTSIAAGTYGLYTIPGETEWTVILSNDSKAWGAYSYSEKGDVARIKATPVKLTEAVESFTIDINDLRNESATLNLIWAKTRVPVKIEVDTVNQTMDGILTAMTAPGQKTAGFYNRILDFCLNNNRELPKALTWATEATAQNPKDFRLLQKKASLQAKLGDKAAALASATAAGELAKAASGNQADFLKANEAFISSLR